MPVKEQSGSKPRQTAAPPGGGLDQRLWFGSVTGLSQAGRRWTLLVTTVLILGWAWLPNGDLRNAWGLPDVMHYLNMAGGQFDRVPAPFSARPLAPLLARWIAAGLRRPAPTGFAVLATISVLWSAGVVVFLALRSGAPRWVLLLIAAVPFWPQLLGDAGLPDPFYTALLAGLLLLLEQGWVVAAAVLMLPLMLTRESTTLTLVCLLLVGWPQLRWKGVTVAVAGTAVGMLIVRRLDVGSLPNPEHMSGGLYLFGKVVSNTVRSTGVLPWSNVYPMLCGTPAWQHALHLGPVRSVGVCAYSAPIARQAWLGFLTTFGLLPMVLLRVGRSWREAARKSLLLRFCLLYGGVSFLMAPTLGTWYERLFGYGWPLLLVAVPRLVGLATGAGARAAGQPGKQARWMLIVLLQIMLGALALRQVQSGVAGWIAAGEALGITLLFVHWQGGSRPAFRP